MFSFVTRLALLWYFLALLPCTASDDPVAIDEVLLLGPVSLAMPEGDLPQAESTSDILAYQLGQRGLPQAGASVSVFGRQQRWREAPLPSALAAGRSLCSLNLEISRYTSGTLILDWSGTVTAYLDGNKLSAAKEKTHFTINVSTGFHQLLLILDSATETSLGLSWEPADAHNPRFFTQPERTVSQEQLLDTAVVKQMTLSPDGRRVALVQRGYDPVAKSWRTLTEIRTLENGALLRRWHNDAPQNLSWSPDGRHLAYTIGDDLWLALPDGSLRKLLASVKGLSALKWHPKGDSVFFQWETEAKPREDGMKRFRGMEDRWPGWRNRHQVFQLELASGWLRPLSAGTLSHTLLDISDDGSRLLVVRAPVDYSQPPYEKSVLMEIDVATATAKLLYETFSFRTALYGPNGLYVLAGPGAFDNLGSDLPATTISNDFDGQIYRYDPATGKATALSKSFAPAITGMETLGDGRLLLATIEKDRSPLYLYDGTFKKIAAPAEIIERFAVSKGAAPQVVYSGTSATTPQRVYHYNPATGESRTLYDPAPKTYAQTRFGEVHAFTFRNSEGTDIDGRYYTPANFNPAKKYPLIIYFYGGTVPVDRQFTGRYPFNWWAANGYIIYVLQPTGSVGYGQAFSARHVNTWGERSAEDVLEGTRAFLDAHSFVGADSMGIMGASYGGFMTMYLTTRSQMYTAAISHAGISSLTGYWGEGFWGYSYSGVASQGSFPWNNPDLYVRQSPVFSADKVTTPLLLLHGDGDTNVPPGQSHNMYTALKLLGKEVELITVAGQDHWILEHDKRLLWGATILAWFDKHLKAQPEWWQALYPDP